MTRRNSSWWIVETCRIVKWRRIASTPETVRPVVAAQCNGGGAFAYNSHRAGTIAVASHCTLVPTPFIDSAPNIQTRTTHRYLPVPLLNVAALFKYECRLLEGAFRSTLFTRPHNGYKHFILDQHILLSYLRIICMKRQSQFPWKPYHSTDTTFTSSRMRSGEEICEGG